MSTCRKSSSTSITGIVLVPTDPVDCDEVVNTVVNTAVKNDASAKSLIFDGSVLVPNSNEDLPCADDLFSTGDREFEQLCLEKSLTYVDNPVESDDYSQLDDDDINDLMLHSLVGNTVM